jgi:hypothetical protein
MPSKEDEKSNLRKLMRKTCESFGPNSFTSYEVYSRMLELPKKNGSRRHYSLTYSEVKQNMARVDYLEKVEDVGVELTKRKTAKYKNKEFPTKMETGYLE